MYKAGLILLMLTVSFTLSVLFVSKRGDASNPISPDECCRCHFNTCEQTQTRRYIHAPAGEEQCSICHIQQSSVPQTSSTSKNVETIDWFAYSQSMNTEHWFEIPQQAEGASLTIQSHTEQGNKTQQKITIPTLDKTSSFPTALGTAVISDLKVTEVKRGVFISATCTWKTDRITGSRLLYGQENIQSTTALDANWTTSHEMTIIGLEAGKTYMVAAAGQDLLGNDTISPTLSFSTARFWSLPEESTTGPQELTLNMAFLKSQKRQFISLTANQPISVKLGVAPNQTQEDDLSQSLPTQHLPLTDPYELNINICITCHPQSKGELSHPVDVQAERGMVIPEEYHTLADGRLTCMTCHEPHASNNPYRLTNSNRKDLCLGCHINF